jgi:MFS family permease
VALGWLVLELTDSPFYLGLLEFARYLPLLVIPPLGGILADRGNRRSLLLAAVAVGAIIITLLATFVQLGNIRVWHILLLVFLSGSGFALYFTIRQTLIAVLVDRRDLLNAFSLDFAGSSLIRILGPSVAGLLIAWSGIASSLYLQVASYATALLMFLRLRYPDSSAITVRSNAWQDIRDQWQYVRSNRAISDLMLLSAVLIPFGMSYRALLPAFARDVLTTGPAGLGMLVGASGVGAIVAGLALATGRNLRHRGAMVLLGAGLFGATLILFSLSRRFFLSLLLIGVGESMAGVYQTLYKVLLQDKIPDELRGRITGMYVLVWGLLPLGSLGMGAVADRLGAPLAVGLGGGICLLFSVVWGVYRSNLVQLN